MHCPGFYIIPRSPTEVYYDVSTEAVEAQLYNWFYCCNTTSNSACPTSADFLATRPCLEHCFAPAAAQNVSNLPADAWADPVLLQPDCQWSPPLAIPGAVLLMLHLCMRRRLRGGQAVHQAVELAGHPGA